MTRQVRDVMHAGVVACDERTTLRDVLRMMVDNTIRSIVVTDSNCALCGIVSQTDLVNASLEHAEDWAQMPVTAIMTRNVLTVKPETDVDEATKVLVINHVHRIIVVDSNDPCVAVGVLSMTDVVRDMMEDD
ncbi:MAG: CBS domain-containing protein [Chloroflexi bacterium]|nr:CBS domain-containing protein [Chloroflexota bacterium]